MGIDVTVVGLWSLQILLNIHRKKKKKKKSKRILQSWSLLWSKLLLRIENINKDTILILFDGNYHPWLI